MLNEVGYGIPSTSLKLDLVFNPSGAYLPGDQKTLEAALKRQLSCKYNLAFNERFTITNLPVARFLDYGIERGNYAEYMEKLVGAFNPATVESLMCRSMVRISWDGYLYDGNFNQMLELPIGHDVKHINDWKGDHLNLVDRNVVLNQHCYRCTAGAGSSCGGSVA